MLSLFYTLMRTGATAASGIGLASGCIFAVLAWRVHAATGAAAASGGLIAATLYLGTVVQPGGAWWHTALSPLFALVGLTVLTTRFRLARKEQMGLAEPKSGRRVSQICANLGAAAVTAALASAGLARAVAMMAMTAAFVEATADTASSEMGQSLPGKVILLTSGQIVPAGTDGGISLAGTLAGCSAGAIVAVVAGICLGLRVGETAACFGAGLAGIFFDSWLGATLERRCLLGNDAVNFSSTVFSALLGGFLALLFFR